MKKSSSGIFPFVVLLLVFPFFLRRKWRVARRIIIHAKPREVFPFVNDVRNWPLWTEWGRQPDIRYSFPGETTGAGAVQQWETRRMNGELRIVRSLPDERIVYDLDVNGGKYRFDGVISLEEVGGSTRVTWLCKWQSGPNPYGRYLDIVCKLMLKRDFQAGLENLRDLVNSRAVG